MTAERLLVEALERGVQLWAEGDDLRFRAPEGALTDDLRRRLGDHKAELLRRLDAGRRLAPASFEQRRLWILDRLRPRGAAYSTAGAFRLRGRLDVAALGAALRALTERHEVLRTALVAVDGRPVQSIAHAPAHRPLSTVDLGGLCPDAGAAQAARLIAAEGRRAFDLGAGPLFRALLVRLADREWRLLLRLHHAVSDGWSEAILHRELAALYGAFARRRRPALPALGAQYADVAGWQRRALSDDAQERLLGAWRRRLDGLEPLRLPGDRPRPERATFGGASRRLSLGPGLGNALERLAHGARASLYMTLLAAVVAWLHRLSGQRDFAVGSPIANRGREELEGLIGLFVNMVAMRARPAAGRRFSELLARVREVAFEAFAHGDLPFDRLVADLAPEREPGRHPLFQVSLALHATPRTGLALDGLAVHRMALAVTAVELDLELHLWRTGAGLDGYLVVATDLFDRATAGRWAGHLETLLAAAASDPRRRVGELPLCSRAQRHQLLAEWNDAGARHRGGELLHRRFESQAARTPEREAVVWQDAGGREATLSYRVLDRAAEALARQLRALGVGPESVAGIFLDRGPGRVVAMLGVLKAAGAYLPLDPAYPPRRLAFLVEDARPAVVVTSGALAARLPAPAARVVRLGPGGRIATGSAGASAVAGSAGVSPASGSGHAAYLLYTSGSTGRPKGTVISHAAICNHMRWMQSALPLDARDRVLQKTPFSFDASVWEFWAPLEVGATLVLTPPGAHRDPAELLRLVRRHRATVLQVVPPLLRLLLEEPSWRRAQGLRRVLCGGEALPRDLLDAFAAAGVAAELYNVYGPTEATIHATWHRCGRGRRQSGAAVAIGRPISGARTLIVDRRLRPAVPGADGELAVGGAGLARGYLERPRLTAGRFVPDASGVGDAARPGARLYHTGDLARHLVDGTLTFRGRLDHQVKVRGHRVEPGEVEAALRAHPAVRDAAVVVQDGASGDARLGAYVVPTAPASPPPGRQLRAFLGRRLPEPMLPSVFVALDSLPLSPTGKVDRRALARRTPAWNGDPAAYAPPRTPIEELVAATWARLLGVARVGARDNFFALGGHSLLAIQALSRIRRSAGVEVALRALFERPTVAALAALIEQARLERAVGAAAELEAPPIIPITGGGEAPLSFPQRRLWFLHQLEPASSAYHVPAALRLSGGLRPEVLEAALREVIRRHQVLRATFASDDGRPRQRLRAAPAPALPLIDLAGLTAGREDAALRLARREASRPFDLARGPLLRARLLRLGEREHLLVVCVHHIVFDGWSHGVLCRELSALYARAARGEPSPLPAPAVQYADYAAWQRRWLEGAFFERRLEVWRRRLAGLAALELPADRPRPDDRRTSRAAAIDVHVEPELRAALERLAVERGASLYMALLAATFALLARLSGRRDVAVGSPVANRGREEVEGAIGFFVNMLVLRLDLAGEDAPSFARLLERARDVALAAYDHQDLPFELLVEALAPERRPGRHPLFQVSLALHHAPGDELELPGVRARRLPLATGGVRLDLELHFWPADDGGLAGRLVYDAALFDAATVAAWADRLQRLVRSAVAEPELPIPGLPAAETAGRQVAAASLETGDGPRVAPRTPTERALAGIWRRVLGVERVGAHDNFFSLGGHSLLAARVAARIRQAFGRGLPLRALFERPTLAGLAERLDAVVPAVFRHSGAAGSAEAGLELETLAPPLPPAPADRGRELPLSFAQERLWFLQRVEPASAAYSLPGAWRLTGELDAGALARALGEVTRRHEVLRTTFPAADGRPRPRVEPAAGFRLPSIDLSALGDAGREAGRLAAAEAARPFVLEREVPLRAFLARLGGGDHVLFLAAHHIASDGWSQGILHRELAALYEAFRGGEGSDAARLPEPAVHYADFALWQRRWLRGRALEALLAYWRRQLDGLPVLALATDRPRRPARGGRRCAAGVAFELPAGLARRLRRLSLEAGASLYMKLLAAFMTLLHRLTGQPEVVVGTPIANRHHRRVEGLIGCFVNTLVLRCDLTGEPTFRRLLERVRALCLDAYEHQDLPFEKLVQALEPDRDLARSPLFQVMFAMQTAPDADPRLAGVEVSTLGLESEPHFDLTVSMVEAGERLLGHLSYDADLFDRTTCARLAASFRTLLDGVAAEPAADLARLALLPASQRHQLTVEWADTSRRWTGPAAVHQLFARRAAEVPDTVAVRRRRDHVTYRELDARADDLAGRLRRRGVAAETLVAVLLDRSPELIAALLAVLKAGAAYLPLDPHLPAARRRFTVRDAGIRHLVATGDLAGELAREVDDTIFLGAARRGAVRRPGAPPDVRPDQLAYCLYTSGSTGRPKAVMVHHRGLANYLSWAQDAYRVAAAPAAPAFTPVGFDLTVTSLYSPLLAGRTVELLDDDPGLEALCAALAGGRGYSFVKLTPAHLLALGSRDTRGRTGPRRIVLGGEALWWQRLASWQAPGSLVVNEYGPTETVVGCCAFETAWRGDRSGPVPIGRPIANARPRVLDPRLNASPLGAIGELHVGGAGVTRGYLRRPALTAAAYLPDAGSRRPGRRVYKTGDRVRFLADGNLVYLDRLDRQLKVRGFRVEPGEVEAALRRQPAVAEAVVVPVPEGDRLVAYATASSPEPPSDERLRRILRRQLPEPMVPSAFVWLEALPVNAHGKVDRAALPPVPPRRPALDAAFAAPATPIEDVLAESWRQLLGLDAVGVDDDFFALGGHSLLATRLTSRIHRAFGVELPLRALFEARTIARLARRVERALEIGAGGAAPPIAPARDPESPLSFAQRRLWFLHRLEPASPAYNMPVARRVDGALDAAALEWAVSEIARRHEVLRTTYPARDGRPRPRVAFLSSPRLPAIDLTALAPAARPAEARRRLLAAAARPFDLEREHPLRTLLVRLAERRHVVFVNIHHIASDGWSQAIFDRELSALYRAAAGRGSSPLPALDLQYRDFAAWQRRWLRGEALERRLAYWRRRLAGLPALELATDRPRPAVLAFRGAGVDLRLPAALTAALERRSLDAGVSLYMTLLAALMTLLRRVTGQPDLAVGTPVAGRPRQELEALIGVFVNTLVLRGDLAGDPTFAALLGRVRWLCLEAYEHQDLPFEKLVEELNPERHLGRSALFQVMFILHNAPSAAWQAPGLAISPFALAAAGTRFDLTLSLYEADGRLAGHLSYNRDLFDPATAARLARCFTNLLAGVAGDASRRLGDLPLLSAAERHQSLVEWNDGRGRPAAGGDLHRLFMARVARSPDAVAVEAGGRRLSYRELARRAGGLARHLRALGVGPEDRIALLIDRSAAAVVGLLAALATGAAYVPLDVDGPADRLAFLLADSRVAVLLTGGPPPPGVPADGLRIVRLGPGGRPAAVRPAGPPATAPLPAGGGHAAYVIYTSGSSGRPKGVVVEHRQVAGYALAAAADLGLEPGLGFALVQPLSVDSSVTTVFGALLTGGCLHVVARADALDARTLAGGFERRRIDVLKIAPSHLAALEDAGGPGVLPRRALVVGGEAWSAGRAERWRRRAACRIWNHYGPTEATVGTHVHRLPADRARRLPPTPPIGRPLANSEAVVADRRLRPAPVGVAGELLLGGDCLARGYLGRPARTAASFVPHPFAGAPGRRLYKTGDLARHRPDGNAELLGRRDHQLKIRGFRVEPGEIEAALRGHPGVREAAVDARRDGDGEPRLRAFVSLRSPELVGDQLAAFLRRKLPAAMVPEAFEVVEALPRLPHGKVDRRALAARALPGLGRRSAFVPPRTAAEEAVAAIWSRVLGRDHVGAHDDFFELGGHSLLVPKLLLELHRARGVSLPVRALFESPTVAGLAAALESPDGGAAAPEDRRRDLWAEVALDAGVRPRRSVRDGGGVLLTGATGFLGAFLLAELLARDEVGDVLCLVRAGDRTRGRARIRDNLRRYGLWRPDAASRIVAVDGDLSRPLLGLSEAAFEALAARVDAVYHCGAWVNFAYPYERLAPANVAGTRETLRLAARAGGKPYHLVSTASVAAAAEPGDDAFREDAAGGRTERLGSGYVRTKWVAEKLAELAHRRGIPVTVYRPGLIGGDSRTGLGNTRDMVWSLIKGFVQLRAATPFGRELNMAPVDYVSRAIVFLSRCDAAAGKVFHLANPRAATWDDALEALAGLGYPLRRWPYDRWRRRLLAELQSGSDNALQPFLSQFLPEPGAADRRRLPIDMRETLRALDGSGIECPPLDAELLRKYVRSLIARGFLEAPGR